MTHDPYSESPHHEMGANFKVLRSFHSVLPLCACLLPPYSSRPPEDLVSKGNICMGNAPSWSATVVPRNGEVVFNLSELGAYLPYHFENAHGEFYLKFNIGRRAVPVGDFVQLARSETPIVAHLEIEAESKHKMKSEASIGAATVDRLRIGTSQSILKHLSDWKPITRLDTDLGLIVVEAQVVIDVNGILKLNVEPPGFFRRGGLFLVGKTDGFVELFVRARFETATERRNAQLVGIAKSALVIFPILFLSFLFRFHGQRHHIHRPRR